MRGIEWVVGAPPSVVQKRSDYHLRIRQFFSHKNVLEVEVPILGNYTATDAFTSSICYHCSTHKGYLQTSPESYLKQYMAHYPHTDVYCLAKVFRDDAPSVQHQPEFTMLEWYRHGFDWQKLSNEVVELVITLDDAEKKHPIVVQKLSYGECFERYVGQCVFDDTLNWQEMYYRFISKKNRIIGVEEGDDKLWKQLIWSDIIEPKFKPTKQQLQHNHKQLTVIYDYPSELSMLAKTAISNTPPAPTKVSAPMIAKRFEIYYNGVELANGWEEELCANTIYDKMQQDIAERVQRDLAPVPIDQPLVNATEKMNALSGVALGIDRLYTQMQDVKSINQVLAFYAKTS